MAEGAPAGGEWQNGLFGCFSDCKVCIITYFLPCYTAGKNAEAVGESCMLCGLALCLPGANVYFPATIRGKIREQKGIQGTFGNDCIMHWCCGPCAIVQEANEVGSLGAAVEEDTQMERQ